MNRERIEGGFSWHFQQFQRGQSADDCELYESAKSAARILGEAGVELLSRYRRGSFGEQDYLKEPAAGGFSFDCRLFAFRFTSLPFSLLCGGYGAFSRDGP